MGESIVMAQQKNFGNHCINLCFKYLTKITRCYILLFWKWMSKIVLFVGNHILLETHLSSSFSLLSLSKSLSFLTCMGALGTNQAAMNLHMTTTCCKQRGKCQECNLLFYLWKCGLIKDNTDTSWFCCSISMLWNIKIDKRWARRILCVLCRVLKYKKTAQINQCKKKWLVVLWSWLRLTSNRITNAKRTAKISQNCGVRL